MKRFLVLFVVLTALFALALSAQTPVKADKEIPAKINVDLDKMRTQIEANGWTFEVGYNEAMQYDLDELAGFVPEMEAPRYDGNEAANEEALPAPGGIAGRLRGLYQQHQGPGPLRQLLGLLDHREP